MVIGSFSSFDLVQCRIDCLNISIGNALIMVFPHTDQRTISILTDYTGKYLCFTWGTLVIYVYSFCKFPLSELSGFLLQVGKHGMIIEFTDPDNNTKRSATYLPEVAAHEGNHSQFSTNRLGEHFLQFFYCEKIWNSLTHRVVLVVP